MFGNTEPVTVSVDYGSMFQSVVTEALKGITEVLPIVIPIIGIMAAITLGLKVFKRLTGKG